MYWVSLTYHLGLTDYASFFLKRFCSFIFRERGREGERGAVKHQCVVASCMPPTGDLACNPGRSPDWESNGQCFGSQARAQSIELCQPGLRLCFFTSNIGNLKHYIYPLFTLLICGIVVTYIMFTNFIICIIIFT